MTEETPAPVKRKRGAQPGHPLYGGRKKGTPNRSTLAARELMERMGPQADPVTFLLQLLSGETMEVAVTDPKTGEAVVDPATGQVMKVREPIPLALRLEAAKAVAPYVHPRLQATQITGPNNGPVQVAELDVAALLMDPEAAKAAQRLSLAVAQIEAAKPLKSGPATPVSQFPNCN